MKIMINAVHDVYRTKPWTALVVTVTAKIVTIKCLIVLSLFSIHNSTGYTIAVLKLVKCIPTRL